MPNEADIQRDLTAAMKARAMEEVYVLRGLVAAIKNAKVDKMTRELAETDIAQLVRKEINKCSEAIEFAKQGGRTELIEQNEFQKSILERYLPQQLSAEDLAKIIGELSNELGTTSIGPLMAKLKERYAGQFEGQTASGLIRKLGTPG